MSNAQLARPKKYDSKETKGDAGKSRLNGDWSAGKALENRKMKSNSFVGCDHARYLERKKTF